MMTVMPLMNMHQATVASRGNALSYARDQGNYAARGRQRRRRGGPFPINPTCCKHSIPHRHFLFRFGLDLGIANTLPCTVIIRWCTNKSTMLLGGCRCRFGPGFPAGRRHGTIKCQEIVPSHQTRSLATNQTRWIVAKERKGKERSATMAIMHIVLFEWKPTVSREVVQDVGL